MVTSETRLSRR